MCGSQRTTCENSHSFYPVGSGDRTQAMSLGSKGLYPLNHLTGPIHEALRGVGSNCLGEAGSSLGADGMAVVKASRTTVTVHKGPLILSLLRLSPSLTVLSF